MVGKILQVLREFEQIESVSDARARAHDMKGSLKNQQHAVQRAGGSRAASGRRQGANELSRIVDATVTSRRWHCGVDLGPMPRRQYRVNLH